MRDSGKTSASYSSTWPGVMDFLPAPGPAGESGKRMLRCPQARPQVRLRTSAQPTQQSLPGFSMAKVDWGGRLSQQRTPTRSPGHQGVYHNVTQSQRKAALRLGRRPGGHPHACPAVSSSAPRRCAQGPTPGPVPGSPAICTPQPIARARPEPPPARQNRPPSAMGKTRAHVSRF